MVCSLRFRPMHKLIFEFRQQNTGDIACPQTVPVLRSDDVENQLNTSAEVFLKQQLTFDSKKRVVVLPKVMEVFKADFGHDSAACLRFCLGGLDEATANSIRAMMKDDLSIRYQHTADSYYSALKYREDASGVNQVV